MKVTDDDDNEKTCIVCFENSLRSFVSIPKHLERVRVRRTCLPASSNTGKLGGD